MLQEMEIQNVVITCFNIYHRFIIFRKLSIDKNVNSIKNFKLKFPLYYSLELHEAPKWEKGDLLGPIARELMNDKTDFGGSPLIFSTRRTYVLKYIHQAWPFR